MKNKIFCLGFILVAISASGQFSKKNSYSLDPGQVPQSVSLVNLDSDSLLEAVTVLKKGTYWSVFAAKGLQGTATNAVLADSILAIGPPAIADFNADNRIDFVFPLSGSPNTLLLLNQGNLTFKKTTIALGTANYGKIQLADLDNDGQKEIIVIKNSGGWSVLKSSPTGYTVALDSTYQTTDFSVADFDQNGFNDIAVSGKDAAGHPYLKVIEFESSLKVLREVTLPNATDGNIEFGDINSDGHFDLMVAGKNQSGVLITNSFIGQDTTFVSGNSFRGLLSSDMLVADFDSDGKADLALRGNDGTGNPLHWIKTAAGDSLILPIQDITQSAFGDYDRDGDLDLLLATDTLSVVLLENRAVTVNRAPEVPINNVSAYLFTRLFLYWDKPADDHTPQPALTYDLTLQNGTANIVDGQFDPGSLLRQTATHGNLGANNFALLKVPFANYNYTVEGVDNSLFAKHTVQGIYNGGCAVQNIVTVTTCKQQPVQLSTGGQPVLWFSFSKGFLGEASDVKLSAATDTVFSLSHQDKFSCDDIKLFLITLLSKDTLKVAGNKVGCLNSNVEITLAGEWENVVWKDTKGNQKGTGNVLNYKLITDETLIGLGHNELGCIIQQKENLTVSRPQLVLDGDDYKIMLGQSVTLGATGAAEYSWHPATGLNDPLSSHPVATPLTTTLYTLTAFDSLHCTAQASVLVEVLHSGFVPNLFTPNGDGKNDELKIYGLTSASDFHFSLYNREGNLVYESTDWSSVSWDGTKNGTLQPPGLYYWRVEGSAANGQLYLNGKTKGSVLLVR